MSLEPRLYRVRKDINFCLSCLRLNRQKLHLPAELPKPTLGDLADLKSLSVKYRRENNPSVLGYKYEELVDLDTIEVELVPEKKGILLKHNEYTVSSKVGMNGWIFFLCKNKNKWWIRIWFLAAS